MVTKINIPKRIHYCWFGGKEKPEIVTKCIASWKKHLPDYEFVEWNEENFDIYNNRYVKEAYQMKKYAFVSDYVRVHALYYHGGIYLDTDVEVFKSFNDLLHNDSFWGFEQENFIATSTIGAAKGNRLIKLFLDHYRNKKFIKEDGTINDLTNVSMLTAIFEQIGLHRTGNYQKLEEIGTIYPQTYFSPYDYINCRSFKTEETYTVHYFYKSWLSPKTRIKSNVKMIASRIIGGNNIAKLREVFR